MFSSYLIIVLLRTLTVNVIWEERVMLVKCHHFMSCKEEVRGGGIDDHSLSTWEISFNYSLCRLEKCCNFLVLIVNFCVCLPVLHSHTDP